jgi:hypothetical protein
LHGPWQDGLVDCDMGEGQLYIPMGQEVGPDSVRRYVDFSFRKSDVGYHWTPLMCATCDHPTDVDLSARDVLDINCAFGSPITDWSSFLANVIIWVFVAVEVCGRGSRLVVCLIVYLLLLFSRQDCTSHTIDI